MGAARRVADSHPSYPLGCGDGDTETRSCGCPSAHTLADLDFAHPHRFYKMIFAVRKRFDGEAQPLRAAADGASDAASALSATGNGAAA